MTGMIIAAVVVILLLLLAGCYKKVGPNKVLIVTGGWLHGPYVQSNPETGTRVKVIKGGGTFVWPVIQQAQVESLDTFPIDVTVNNVMTIDSVPVNAKASAVLRVGSDPKMIAIASEKMLGLSKEERDNQMISVVKGAVREALTQMTPKDANNRRSFQDAVVEACKPTFDNLGLEITTLKITDIDDDNGYYESLSAKDIANKRAEARKAQATADQEARQAEAEADRIASESEAENKQKATIAQLTAQNTINAKQKEVDINKAQYDAAVQKEQAVAAKAKDIADAEQNAIIQARQVEVNKNTYEATIIAKQEAENDAATKKAAADYEVAAKKADAEAYAIKAQGDAEADKTTKIGTAKANAQKALAEALSKRGSEQSLASKVIDIMPEIAKAQSEALSHVDKLTVLNGASGLNQVTASSFKSTVESIKDATGIDVAKYIKDRGEGQVSLKGNAQIDANGDQDSNDEEN